MRNLKSYSKLTLSIFFNIHVVIDFNGNHHNFFRWILKRLWTHNGLLNWQHNVCRIEKWKMWFKKYFKVVSKQKLKNKTSLNEEFISEVHCNFPYIYIYKVLNDVIVVNVYPWKSISH